MDASRLFSTSGMQTPCIFLDTQVVEKNYRRVKEAFGNDVAVCFSVKANNHPMVLRTIHEMGGGFDVASAVEIRDLLALGVPPSRIAFSNPVKVPADIAYAHAQGVRYFAADSELEIDKLASLAPGSSIYIRMAVKNEGSGWPLAKKFGVLPEEAARLLELARDRGLDPTGLTFHVGSQCVNLQNWRGAIIECAQAWQAVKSRGISLRMIDLGGGVPARYDDAAPDVRVIGATVRQLLAEYLPDARTLMIEPGRFVAADAGILVTSVIGRASRNGKTCIYHDAGVFNGLMETYECFWYPLEFLRSSRTDENEFVTLFGPTCDSVDQIVEDVKVPVLALGDKVVFKLAGAYTNSNMGYNGFAFPKIVDASGALLEEEKKDAVASLYHRSFVSLNTP
jgi:ornithine decarboxylase